MMQPHRRGFLYAMLLIFGLSLSNHQTIAVKITTFLPPNCDISNPTSDLIPGEYRILGLLTQPNNDSNVMFGYFIARSLLLIFYFLKNLHLNEQGFC
jgi:hypothetical protein